MADTSERRRHLICPRCGAENLPNNRFCAQCGMNLRGGETQGALAAPMAPKSGAVLPYSPGTRGPGRTALLAIAGVVLLLVGCLALSCLYLSSNADRAAPRTTPIVTPR